MNSSLMIIDKAGKSYSDRAITLQINLHILSTDANILQYILILLQYEEVVNFIASL